ncbi:unnamed protein product [Parajaminaea phylloscopi]
MSVTQTEDQVRSLKVNFAAVERDIEAILKVKDYDDGSIAPVLLRLAWHSSGTFDKATNTGGSNGAGMRWEKEGGDEANAGLQHARVFLEPIKEKYPDITYSDLWTLAGVVAVRAMGGPNVPWKPGRSDFANDELSPPRGRLPDGAQAADHLRHIFYRMGFNDQEIVALSGAHNLGRCHPDRSGFKGPWSPNMTRFSNMYYKLLLQLDWKKKQLPKESAAKGAAWQWVAKQPGGDDEDEELMMLPTDHSLIEDPGFRPWVEKYAQDKDAFFDDFSKVFAKLVELGVYRDEDGVARHHHLQKGSYQSAPKKSSSPKGKGTGDGVAAPVARDNQRGVAHARSKL